MQMHSVFHDIFSPRTPLSRSLFVVYIVIAVSWYFLVDSFFVGPLAASPTTQHVLWYLFAFIPAASVVMLAEHKRMRAVAWRIRAPIILLVVLLSYTLPFLFPAGPTIAFHGVTAFLLFASSALQDGGGGSLVVRGYVYSLLKDPPTLEVASETDDRYIVKVKPDTIIRDELGSNYDFASISEKRWVEAAGSKIGQKTLRAALIRLGDT